MTTDPSGREVIGLTDAARMAGVTHQTIRNWANDGVIHTGNDPEVLREMNHSKNGRRYERYYYVDEVKSHSTVQPHPGLITISEAAKQLGVTRRTIHRIRSRQGLEAFIGPGQTIYLKRSDIDKQEAGVTYHTRPSKASSDDDTGDD